VAFYHPGVGTMEATGAVTSVGQKAAKVLGRVIGYRLETDNRDACVFLMNHFEERETGFICLALAEARLYGTSGHRPTSHVRPYPTR
jgi:hypothetical protein